jgi:glycosyltransferase involved in cell wall biosynthesis
MIFECKGPGGSDMVHMKKIAIIGSVGLPAKYGGWETLVHHLTRKLEGKFQFTVYCSSNKYSEKQDFCNGARLEYINLDANGVQSIPYDIISMLKAIRFADTLLILGVSGCCFLPGLKLISRKKCIVNIDGLEWRRAKWGRFAKWFLKLSEAVAVRFADVVVTDNKAIQEYVSREYGRESVLIAYGGDHAVRPTYDRNILNQYGLDGLRYAFKVCRIEPENNLDLIIKSFAFYSRLDLVIVGNWENSGYGIKLRKKYGDLPHIHLLDPIYDHEILNQMRSACHVYVHGHSAGGTNPSLVEAMSLGLPVAAFDCVFNRETTCGQALFFNSSDGLGTLLNSLDDDLLAKLGIKMKQLADQLYTWDKISSGYAGIF